MNTSVRVKRHPALGTQTPFRNEGQEKSRRGVELITTERLSRVPAHETLPGKPSDSEAHIPYVWNDREARSIASFLPLVWAYGVW